ncbi:hypothetical protein [Pseudonocardia charpentierae]|uniref:Uncharacterized protein n=1 Tax=Pseudonocardia charpentierae TaxID=3075545 RepID=A0ABU2NI04_9PSEU|nr:hypothetical protein [Pseudonocardia sp. DSM 45834]MDT0353597.1 hypothetical protein [Pseudonocardia sp. DSM 45834]
MSSKLIQEKSDEVIQVPGGEVMIGLNAAIAAADFGEEQYMRTCVLNGMYLGVAQRVALRRLAQQSELLTDPAKTPATASDLSRSINAYRSVYSWTHASPPNPIINLVNRYREIAATDASEAQLHGFATAASTEVSAETNTLLALLAVLGLAVAIGGAVITGAEWKGWNVGWGALIAATCFGLLLLLPFSRPLRQELSIRGRPSGWTHSFKRTEQKK